MLDYAANAVRYWPLAELRTAFEATADGQGRTGEERLREAFPDTDPEEFWQRVGDNLTSGHIRMVFVADHLPAELVRVIEFLNEQMRPAEVLGVEVPQYVGEGHQVLVPRVVGRTSSAIATKGSRSHWDEEGFLAAAAERQDQGQVELFRRLFDHVRDQGGRLSWGRAASPGVSGWYSLGGTPAPVWTANAGGISGNNDAYLYIYLPEVHGRVSEEVFDAFVNDLAAIPAYKAKIDQARASSFQSKYPQVLITDLVRSSDGTEQLFAALDRLIAGTRR
jgi:hypothetical protein